MNKKNNIIASIHVDVIGNEKKQDVAVRVGGNPLTLGAAYMELTKALLSNGVPKLFIEAAYMGAVKEASKSKSEEDQIKDTLATFAELFR